MQKLVHALHAGRGASRSGLHWPGRLGAGEPSGHQEVREENQFLVPGAPKLNGAEEPGGTSGKGEDVEVRGSARGCEWRGWGWEPGWVVSLCELEELPESLSFLVFKIIRRVTSALPPSGVRMALEKSSVLFRCQGLLKGATSHLACCWSAPPPPVPKDASRGEGGG